MPHSRLLLPFLLAALPLEDPAPPRSTAEVAELFLRHVFVERDLDAAELLHAEDVLFVDPTADVWGAALARGVRGRENVLAIMRGARVESVAFDVETRFVCGEYALLVGALDWKPVGRPAFEGVPLAILLRVQDGAIVERWDHGAYEGRLPGAAPPSEEARAARAELVRGYVTALSERRFDEAGALLADEPRLVRPLAGESEVAGRDRILATLREATRSHELAFERTLFNAGRAILIGELRDASEEPRAPVAVVWILTLEGGRVVEHRELLDTCALEPERR